jgi:type VI secretion system secreted protein VgrG
MNKSGMNRVKNHEKRCNGNGKGICSCSNLLNHETQIQWDAYDQQVQVTDALKGTQHYHYDALGRLEWIANARGERTMFTYDNRDRLIEQTGFDGRRQTWERNAAGEVTSHTDHNGSDKPLVTRVLSDALGRTVGRSSSDGSDASYSYDVRGLMTHAQSSVPGEVPVQVKYEYDAAARRTAEMHVHHNKVWRLTHEFDALGHRTNTRVPDAGTIAWQRYGSGHIHGVLLNGNALADIERNPLHQETKRTQGNVTHTMLYERSGQLAKHLWADTRTAAKPWRTWEHDWTGNVKTLDDSMRGGKKQYQYDALSRLTNAGNEQFIYDATGNLLDVSGLDPIGYGKPAGDRLHTLRTGRQRYEQYAYDAHGRRTERAENDDVTTRYGYDAVHQLREVTQANGVKARYEYDALGRRVAKHVTAKGRTTTTLFVWDGDWMIQEVTNGKTITYVKHPDHAGPLAKIENGKTYHYVTDHIGTPQELHDASGRIVWAADYSAYGLVRKLLADEVSNPIRFAGQYYDAETGLRYNRFRYYDAVAGRYLTQDPIGLKGGINQYAYVKGNPLSRIDSLGLDTCVLVTKNSLGFGDHAALYTSSGYGGQPFLYDPSGGYNSSYDPNGDPNPESRYRYNDRINSDIVFGQKADIGKFDAYHKKQGDSLSAVCKKTTPEQEQDFLKKARELGTAFGPTCARHVSTVISGSSSFPNVESETLFPGNLLRDSK